MSIHSGGFGAVPLAPSDPADLRQLAAALSADLARDGIAHAISGSIAMAAHGYVRGTLDLDVLVVTTALRLPHVFEIVRRHGFSGADRDLILALQERRVAALRRGPLAVEILVPVIPYHEQLIGRAVRLPIDGHQVPFVSLEDLVVLKMVWARTKDLADIDALVALDRARLDTAYIRRTLASIVPDGDERLVHIGRLLG